ncbi:uncharacterized protein LOC134763999 isoform X2 [Penaeus indicus]|uniref:uncharacterized protein LOC134763999 isoform X2 n=1 Tax=Penaeus indicus TaxID=29960 RepID=UPI00300CBB98
MRYSSSVSRTMLRVLYYLPPPLFNAVEKCRKEIPRILASERYKILILSTLLFLTILLLSIPVVPERILGIRSPEITLENYYHDLNTSLSTAIPPDVNQGNDPHKIQKRHIPHKFWARVRPHNRFRKKKRRSLVGNLEKDAAEGHQEAKKHLSPKVAKGTLVSRGEGEGRQRT